MTTGTNTYRAGFLTSDALGKQVKVTYTRGTITTTITDTVKKVSHASKDGATTTTVWFAGTAFNRKTGQTFLGLPMTVDDGLTLDSDTMLEVES